MHVAVIADYDDAFEPLPATNAALAHASEFLGVDSSRTWVATEDAPEWSRTDLANCDGIIIGPGSPLRNDGRAYHDYESVLEVVRRARSGRIPLLATCAGFQHVALEYLRNVVGIRDASATYYDDGGTAVIGPLACSLRGQRLPISLQEGSMARAIYGKEIVNEEYYCRFGVKAEFQRQLSVAGLLITGVDGNDGDARIIELRDHPFFVGTCFVPQVSSSPARPHPLIKAFIQAAVQSGGVSSPDGRKG